MNKNLGVFIGRFQPLHKGHIEAIRSSLDNCKSLLILVGSANASRSIKNPWTYEERKRVLNNVFILNNRPVIIKGLNDQAENHTWISEVRYLVEQELAKGKYEGVTLFGHFKDGNDYLNWFPDYGFKEVGEYTEGVNATSVREKMFEDESELMPLTVRADWDFYKDEAERFKDYPYPDTLNFNCSDALVVCLDRILMVKRKFAPGKGTWALPGGFKGNDEVFLDAAVRELYEETNLRVPEKVVRGSLVKNELFESTKSKPRAPGIPRNTMAFLFNIKPNPDGLLPRANGADDAEDVEWMSIYEAINGDNIFSDHATIISKMLGIQFDRKD